MLFIKTHIAKLFYTALVLLVVSFVTFDCVKYEHLRGTGIIVKVILCLVVITIPLFMLFIKRNLRA